MNSKNLVIGGACVLALVLLIGLGLHSDATLKANLPPKQECKNEAEARSLAFKESPHIFRVLGTGSMAPFIPAAPAGKVPEETTVAFVVMNTKTYDQIEVGDLCDYVVNGGHILHLAASKDSDGWIMTGLHNEHYENWRRVTEKNFVGVVKRVFVWPLE